MSESWTLPALKEHFEKTVLDLKEHIERIFLEKDKALDSALISTKEAINIAAAAMKEAVAVAEKNNEKWRENANEWRAAMSDKDKNFMLKSEFSSYKESTDKIIDELKTQVTIAASERKGLRDGWGYLVGAVGLVGGIIGIAFAFLK